MTRFLPGSVAVVAAFTVPEFSVGAGDLANITGFDDLPEPAAKPRTEPPRLGVAPVQPKLAGVRYAAILDLDLTAPAALAVPGAVSPPISPAAERPEAEALLAASLPVGEAAASDFIPAAPLPLMAPAADAGEAEVAVPASLPAEPVAALAVTEAVDAAPALSAPAAPPATMAAPSLPRIERVEAAPLPPALAIPPAAIAPPPVLAAPSAPVEQASPAARGMIEQVALARIAASPAGQAAPQASAQPAPQSAPAKRPAPSEPVVTLPAAAPAPVGAAAALAAPGTRAPVSAPAPATQAARPAAPAPAVAAAAVAVPRPASPALAGPAASKPPIPEITARLLTRVDGKTAGAVDFQQTPSGLKVRLGSIVEVLADRYDTAQLARIRGSAAGNQYLTLAELQAQGVPISYDPVYDEFNVGLTDTRPKDARKVHIDQISTPERGLGAAGMDQIRR